MKPSKLEEEAHRICKDVWEGDNPVAMEKGIADILSLISQTLKEWGEEIVGEDEPEIHSKSFADRYARETIRQIGNDLRAEQRQRLTQKLQELEGGKR